MIGVKLGLNGTAVFYLDYLMFMRLRRILLQT